jgi:ankyrin repeat protein
MGGVLFGALPAISSASPPYDNQETLNQELRQAAIVGVIPRIERLIQSGADINAQAPHGETALDYAIRFGRDSAALRLLGLGADPDATDDSGVSPLLRAAGQCNASHVVEALLKAGADVNHRDGCGRTALMNAAQFNCTRSAAVLLLKAKDRIDLDARNDSFETASDLARQDSILQMIELARAYRYQKAENALPIIQKFLK